MSLLQSLSIRTRYTPWLLLAIIVAVAALLRLGQLDRLPPGLSFDEAYNVLIASHIQTLLPPPVYIPVEFGKEPALAVLTALIFRLAGQPFAEGGRLASALSGVLTVGLLFFTAREVFRKSVGEGEATALGLLSAGVLAVLYWHVHYSRLGMEPPMVPTFSTLAFYLLWLALNRGHWPLFALAGAALSLCLYTYLAGYMVPLVAVFHPAPRLVDQAAFASQPFNEQRMAYHSRECGAYGGRTVLAWRHQPAVESTWPSGA